ncbi:uncharacterized protein LOC103382553 isoform X2 [Cynoglossus semilaevis]|uniref:uncharacterized protein LOC103382553 isoform X2 n=1 Tax=Cynoglossus semilaevis TaxID=244447 RepID=UPI000D62437B|nr:uncharacterized protein LOC103382553 isoform X2 [Cynoglossus semilaevis]
MPSNVIERVDLFLRAGKYPEGASKSSKAVTRAASKHFVFKDDCLWRTYRGRLLKVVRSDEEMREILTRYHNDNNHTGRVRMVKEIMERTHVEPSTQPVQFCLAYGCEASSYIRPDLSFYRFPKEPGQRSQWLSVAQRDEGSLRFNSYLCSQHFDESCFTLGDEGQMTLSSDAVPTIMFVAVADNKICVPTDEDFLRSDTLEDLLSTAAAAAAANSTDPPDAASLSFDLPTQLQDHQYSLPTPDEDHRKAPPLKEDIRRNTVVKQSFTTYNHIARYLSHRVLPMLSKKSRNALKRMAKRFGLIDGVLMYTRVSPPVRVPRSREEVNNILQRFHDDRGHYGQGICQREITKNFYWSTMTRDLAAWISSCSTCVNRTKRRWLRCSIHTCHNCCGPVERRLGLTFHTFPLHNTTLLDQWLKAVGRPHWYPRLWSSICSKHFTEDCFEQVDNKVSLRPDAVPTLLIHSSPAVTGPGAYFDKYDTVEHYLRTRTYPSGLSFVEKNTFRRFCRKFVIKDDQLHMAHGDRVRLVLRSREQVEVALNDYHNELNHLDASKCLRLLNERFFWKTMRPDVIQWISGCSMCSRKNKKKLETSLRSDAAGSAVLLSGREDDEDDDGEIDEGKGREDDEERQRLLEFTDSQDKSAHPVNTLSFKPEITVVLQDKSRVQDQPQARTQSDDQEVTFDPQATVSTHTLSEVPAPPVSQKKRSSSQLHVHSSASCPAKRSKELDVSSTSFSSGQEPVVAASTKPWPVFTIASSATVQTATAPTDSNSSALHQKPSKPLARTIIQQCSQAKVKVKPPLDGAEAQWAEIQQGMVVYVCFYHGATEDVTHEMANTLMSTKFFRKTARHSVSVLDLPGSVLFIPQESLQGVLSSGRRMQYQGGCEKWQGAQLFSSLVLACRELMHRSTKCTDAGVSVEQGVYGQKQEIVLNSAEPLTHLLEF